MADSTFAEHVANTNNRLASIKASLIEVSSFPEACVELTKWCSDPRAFAQHFEDNLMMALQAAMENGTKENYDFNLTHALVSACFSHRKHLSKPSATRIGRWYEQMRRLKKNGGKRKRAPPKPKESTLPVVVTSPNGSSSDNNNSSMFSPSSDGSMWNPSGPMATPGSSAGGPFPGPMGPMPAYGQALPYGQMEGNHAMYDHRMMAARAAQAQQQQQQQRAPGMMAEYPQMGMAPNGGAPGQMMRMPIQYPAGQPQMPGHPQMQYGQMMRAPPVSVYGQMNHPQPYSVTAHPNVPYIQPDVKMMYDMTFAYRVERELVEESTIINGNHGCEAEITPEAFQMLESDDYDVILSVWQAFKGNENEVQFRVYVNQQLVLSNTSENRTVSVKRILKSGINLFQFGYVSPTQLHRLCCEFVTKKPLAEFRRLACQRRGDVQSLANQGRIAYAQMAQKKPAGVVSIPMNCSLSKKRMLTPARHNDCKKALFDMGFIISQNKNKTRYYCSHCNLYFKFDDIIVDFFMLQAIAQMPPAAVEIVVDKNGGFRPAAEGESQDAKPKRGKKRNDDTSIKRIKSETFVKQEPMYPDMHGRGVPFSPMPMPGSVPPDWSRLQSPSFSMHSPNKIQLGPATPATPGMVFQNPASVGSMLNMSSPRQMMPHPIMGEHPTPAASGSAPYTPDSVKNDRLESLMVAFQTNEFFMHGKPEFIDNEKYMACYLNGTNDVDIDLAVYL